MRRGRRILLLEASFEIIAFEEGLGALTAAARDVGEVISTLPAPGETAEAQIRFSILVAADVTAETVNSRIELSGVSVRQASSSRASAAPERVADEAAPVADSSPDRNPVH